MIQPITQERWHQAQAAELKTVTYDKPELSRAAYANIFGYLGMSFNQTGKQITEVGCGAYPAVMFCHGLKAALVVEPLWFATLKEMAIQGEVMWVRRPFEDWTEWHAVSDEVWVFNVMQHVRDPELFVQKAKETAPVIRYFEPVDYGTCEYHPHTFAQDDFAGWFGEAKRYTDRLPGFFDADCCYGNWNA